MANTSRLRVTTVALRNDTLRVVADVLTIVNHPRICLDIFIEWPEGKFGDDE